jgi:uncharacterized protein
MFFSVSEMRLGSVRFSETLAPGAIDFLDPQLRQVAPIVTSGTATLTEATMEICVAGHVATRVEAACDRCLELVAFPIDADFELLYRPPLAGAAELAVKGPDAEVGFYEGDGLKLADVLAEEILLLLPMQRVCREDCKGICPVCGQDRNQAACSCHQEVGDDRWAGLRNL